MMNVESYRRYAADCVRQAQGEETPEDRNILLNVALAWLRLAKQTEAIDAGRRMAPNPWMTSPGCPMWMPMPANRMTQEEPRRLAS